MYKMRKVYESRLPQEIFNVVSLEQGNDSYCSWTIGDEFNQYGCGVKESELELVDKWLLESGAEEGETVLFLVSW